MKRFVSIALLTPMVVLVGCNGIHPAPEWESGQRRIDNVQMVNDYFDEMDANGIIAQKTLYPHHFIYGTSRLNEIGTHDLRVLSEYYRKHVMTSLQVKTIHKDVHVYFDYDLSAVRDDAVPVLDEAISLLNTNLDADILITGHADVRGGAVYNERLGADRADAVSKYMISHDIAPSRVRILSRGELDAIAPESDEEGMQGDRNAHFLVAVVTEFPVTLNLRQADASDDLYRARKRAVSSFFQASGVDISVLDIVDGLPGGGGMQSREVLTATTPPPAGNETYTTITPLVN